MLTRFRPLLHALESREVPASFSARLPDGTPVSGTFSAPAGVDPSQGYQSLAINDLAVSVGGSAYTVGSGATATYMSGTLWGVNATATGPGGSVSLMGNGVWVGTSWASLALDGSDTQATFALSDGNAGAISYAIPWSSVDATEANQSVSSPAST